MTGIIERPVFPLGLPDPNFRIIGSGHTDSVTFGSGNVAARIALGGTALVDTPSFGSGLVDPGPVAISGTGLSDPVSFGSGGITWPQSLSGTGLLDPVAFGAGTAALGGYTILDDEADVFPPTFGSGSVEPGPVSLPGTGLVDGIASGDGSISVGPVEIEDDEDDVFGVTFGTGLVQPGVRTVPGSGLGDPVTFGSGTLRPGERIIVDSSNDNFAPTFGAGTVAPGPVTLGGSGIPPTDPRVGRGTVRPTFIYFVGPTLRYGHGRRNSPLWWVENAEGITLLRESGVWREALCPTGDEIAAAERAYRGGYRTPLTGDQKNELVAAGYGAYIEED